MSTILDTLPPDVVARISDPDDLSIRDDLRAIPAAEAAGWRITFRYSWHDPATFTRDNVAVWLSGESFPHAITWWQRAVYVNGRAVHLARFDALVDALACNDGT